MLIYELTLKFPVDERFGLTSQLRRAAVSITANIAEGFGRFSFQGHIQFCRQVRGSAFEVHDHLATALDQAYITKEVLPCANQLSQRVIQALNDYIRSAKNRQLEA
jgi:four helix bundle protein